MFHTLIRIPKTFLTILGALVLVVSTPSIWRAGQRSYTDFQCTGDLDAQGHCVADSRNAPPGAPFGTMPASPLNNLGPGPAADDARAQAQARATAVAATGPTTPLPVDPTLANAPPMTVSVDPIALLNVERQRAGLTPLREDGQLAAAASAHTRYMVQNRTVAHEETPGMPGFLGETPQARMRAVGYGAGEQHVGTGEVLATLGGDTNDAMDSLMAAIYHRVIMLDPSFQDAGAAVMINGDSLVLAMDLGMTGYYGTGQPTRLVLYPTPSQTDVPPAFVPSREVPNPVPERARVGYPISVEVANTHTLTITGMTLRDVSGTPLPTKMFSAATDAEFRPNEWAFIPWDPLRPGTRYDVTLDGAVDGQAFHVQWSFTTAVEVPFQAVADAPVLRPGQQTWIRYSKTDATTWQVSMHSEGAATIPVQIQRQSWRGLVVQALPGCEQPQGCPVQVIITDDLGHVGQVPLRVMPS